MFRIVCYPSSGNIELYLTEIRSDSQMFVVCSILLCSILPDDGSHMIRNMSELIFNFRSFKIFFFNF